MRRLEERKRALSGPFEIGDESAGGGKFGALETAIAVERRDPEQVLQPIFRGDAVEGFAWGRPGFDGCRRPAIRHDQFGGGEARKLGIERAGRDRRYFETSGRDVGGRQPDHTADLHQSGQPVCGPCIEQAFFGDRACRHHADDPARHERFGAALAGFGRRFGLLGDGDAMAGLDQAREIGLGRMRRDAAHGNRCALMFATRRQRDIEAGGCNSGIIEEQLEKITHSVKKKTIRRLRLEREILRHHRRRGIGIAMHFPCHIVLIAACDGGGHAPIDR